MRSLVSAVGVVILLLLGACDAGVPSNPHARSSVPSSGHRRIDSAALRADLELLLYPDPPCPQRRQITSQPDGELLAAMLAEMLGLVPVSTLPCPEGGPRS